MRSKDGALKFFDFEYFGWDDPVKLISDFYFNLGMNLNGEMKRCWIEKSSELLLPKQQIRLFAHLPLYGCIWVLIGLNEYKNETWERRVAARELSPNLRESG